MKYIMNSLISLCLISTIACSGSSEPDTNPVPNSPVNASPTALTSDDFFAEENSSVSLDASGSTDSDGTITNYSWTQTSGTPTVTLTNSTTVVASFTAPEVSADTPLTFQLVVTDNDGATSSDAITITITPITSSNNPPIANAGTEQQINTNSGTVTLDASQSSDPEGGTLTYLWQQTSGNAVFLSDPTAVTTTFSAPAVADVLIFSLIVTDDVNQFSTSDSVRISVVEQVSTPQVSHSTFMDIVGFESSVREMAYDSQGNIVFVGTLTLPANQLTTYPNLADNNYHLIGDNLLSSADANANNNGGDGNIIVGKISADLSTLLWRTIIGGSGKDRGYGLRLDDSDSIYIAGRTSSPDFPTTTGSFDTTFNGGSNPVNHHHGPSDAYALKLSADGSTLTYSTYLGGSDEDTARGGLAIDNQGNAYICGSTQSASGVSNGTSDFLANPSSDPTNALAGNAVNAVIGGLSDGFISKLSADGTQVLFTRYMGSGNDIIGEELPVSCAIDNQGAIHALGMVWGSDVFTTNNAFQQSFGGVADVYYLRLNDDATSITYATLYGGSGGDFAEHGLFLDTTSNEIVFSGETESLNLPITTTAESAQDPLVQLTHGGGLTDGFIAKLDTSGQPVFAHYVGGTGSNETAFSALLIDGSVVATGRTASANFSVTQDAQQPDFGGGNEEAWYRHYSAQGVLQYSSFFGGNGDIDYGRFILPTPQNKTLLAIKSSSSNALTTSSVLNNTISTNGNNGEDVMLVVYQ